MEPRAVACRLDPRTRSPITVCSARVPTIVPGGPVLFPVGTYVIDTGASYTIIGSDTHPPFFNLHAFLQLVQIVDTTRLGGIDGHAEDVPLVEGYLAFRPLAFAGAHPPNIVVHTLFAFAAHFQHSVIGTYTLETATLHLNLRDNAVDLTLYQYITEHEDRS